MVVKAAEKKTNAADTTEETRELYVEVNSAPPRIVTIPAHAKVTFGLVAPGGKGGGGWDGGYCLRVYNSRDDQLAVFCGVKSFRDLSLPVRERVTIFDYEESHNSDGSTSKRKIKDSSRKEWREVTVDGGGGEDFDL